MVVTSVGEDALRPHMPLSVFKLVEAIMDVLTEDLLVDVTWSTTIS